MVIAYYGYSGSMNYNSHVLSGLTLTSCIGGTNIVLVLVQAQWSLVQRRQRQYELQLACSDWAHANQLQWRNRHTDWCWCRRSGHFVLQQAAAA